VRRQREQRRELAGGALALPYLSAYPASLQAQVRGWLAEDKAEAWLLRKHPEAHAVRTDKGLYDYVDALKGRHMRNAGTLNKVAYDGRIHVVHNALGLHTRRAVVQGSRINARHEIRIGALFKQAPEAFLRMIVVHELAHLREPDHDKAFYQLCTHMEPDYHQLEFELRLYLSWVDHSGRRLWGAQP
jgi:predicted metal-dependent hydrolase